MQRLTSSIYFVSLACALVFTPIFANAYEYKLSKHDKKIFKKSYYNIRHDRYNSAILGASKANNKIISKTIKWVGYQDGYSKDGLQEVADFLTNNPHWPSHKKIRNKIEFSLTGEEDTKQIINYFSKFTPLTGHGMRIFAEAKIASGGNKTEIIKLLRQGWKQGDFTRDQENSFLKAHRKIITKEDIYKRVDRLLWDGKWKNAQRLYPKIDKKYKPLILARIKLARNRSASLLKIPKNMRKDPGLLYQQIKRELRNRNYDRMYNMLKNVKTTMPFQQKWWKMKNRLIRELLDKNKIKAAYDIANHHGNKAGTAQYADAQWLAGWISLRFLGKPKIAYKHFNDMYQNVSYPISLSRASYWAGRAALANNNKDLAQDWFVIASKHSTTFYGQLAYSKLNDKNAPLIFPNTPQMGVLEKNGKLIHELLMAAYILEYGGKNSLAERFIKPAISQVDTPSEMSYISEFGLKIGRTNLAVIAAKRAMTKGVTLIEQGWPTTKYMPKKISIEEPFALSIIRQESVFNTKAKSSAKAMGLMQLIPPTAKRMARSAGLRYSKSKLLSNPKYNITLGSHYLSKLLNQWEGSYILAISSYNAGPGNARKWAEKYNDPRNITDIYEIIDWIESIPYGETRNYVQRVLENLQVYRSKMTDNKSNIIDDLLRGTSS